MAALSHTITVTLDNQLTAKLDEVLDQLAALQAERQVHASSGVAAAIAGGLIVAGSTRQVVSRRRLLTFGLRG